MENRRISAFIFDLDGVLTDTSELHFLAWKRLADEEGIPFTREDNEALRGVSRRESLRRLLKGRVVTEAQALEMMERKNRYYRRMLENLSPENILPGALEFLESSRQHGLKLAVASVSKNTLTVIERIGIGGLFEAVVDGYCVVNYKPAPDLFIFAAGALRTPVSECVVFEDAEAGVEAALRAGMRVIGLGPAERVGGAHLVLPSLSHAQVDAVIASLSGRGIPV